jgi:epoxyqueuosine reductase
MMRVSTPRLRPYLWIVPPLVPFRRRRVWPRIGAWPAENWLTPESLRSSPSLGINREEVERFGREAAFSSWGKAHPETSRMFMTHGWRSYLPTAPYQTRSTRFAQRVAARRPPAPQKAPLDPAGLTAAVKAKAAELGISACGVARHSEPFTFYQCRGRAVGDRVVVGLLEADWKSTQTIPKPRGETSFRLGDGVLIRKMALLGEYIASLGYQVRFNTQHGGDGLVIPYAAAAGLGQLGLNGQLLTPRAGSRCRIWTLNTDAPLVFDEPVDYGIPKICDACQVCVRRCPSGAITSKRRPHHGVTKAAINPERCIPVVAQSDHCAVCTKVCPVQRYGLAAVVEEFTATGRIPGKGTDELEAYEFHGKRYPSGTRPKLPPEYFSRVHYDHSTGIIHIPSEQPLELTSSAN